MHDAPKAKNLAKSTCMRGFVFVFETNIPQRARRSPVSAVRLLLFASRPR